MRGSRAIDGPSSLKLLRPGGRAPGLVIGCAVIRPFDQLCKRLEKIVTIWRLFDKHIPQVALVALPPEIAERGKRVQRAGDRSAERRVGKECVCPCHSRGSP